MPAKTPPLQPVQPATHGTGTPSQASTGAPGKSGTPTRAKVTGAALQEMKKRAERIVMVTAYDYPFAKLADAAGVDMLLVGDSLGMVVLGFENTLPVTMEHMLHHTQAVARARRGEGPTLIEAKTHRKGGHAEGEDAFLAGQQYRTPDEREAAMHNDPLLRIHSFVVEKGYAAAEQLEMLDQATVQAVVNSAPCKGVSPTCWPSRYISKVLPRRWQTR